jgi:CRISPR-associated protein Csb3
MNTAAATFSVKADVTNPGQFFACCGLFELASRLWPAAEGWFDEQEQAFQFYCKKSSASLCEFIYQLRNCEIAGLTPAEKKERDELERERRQLQRDGDEFSEAKEARRLELGTKAREGAVIFGTPFSLALNWWQSGDEETPKTWAGRQEIHKIARAAQDALSGITDFPQLFDHACVMHLSAEYCLKPGDETKVVEPFYFDARRFVHALDTGYSLDVQDAETFAHPAVELLALVGLQRFRPVATEERGGLNYFIWCSPLCVSVASAVAGGAVWHPRADLYKSSLRYRDNQRRYKAFSPANRVTSVL